MVFHHLTAANRHIRRQSGREGEGGGEGGGMEGSSRERAGGGLKDERLKEREEEGGRSWQHTAGPRYLFFFFIPKPPAWSFMSTTPNHSTGACVSESSLYHLYLSALSPSKANQQSIKHPSHQSDGDYISFIKIPQTGRGDNS